MNSTSSSADGNRVSVIIRCLNEEQHIGRLLAGLERQAQRPDEVIVVDSGSTDATRDIAGRYQTTIVGIGSDEFSFGRALNIGCGAATGNILVIMSAHVYPILDSHLRLLVDPFSDEKVALTYGRQVGDHRTRFSESRVMAQWFPGTSIEHQPHAFCNNANAAIRKDIWKEIQYDEGLTGLEDLDWAGKAQRKGYRISYVAEAPVVHVHQESWGAIVNRYRREAIAYRQIHGRVGEVNGWEALYLAGSNILRDYVQAAHEGVLASNLKGIPSFRVAQFAGAWLGFRRSNNLSEDLKRRMYYPSTTLTTRIVGLPGTLIDYRESDPSEGSS